MDQDKTTKGKRGFAAMDPERQREIASKGGRRAHEEGKAHEFTTDEARVAGTKGGVTVSTDREHMADIGRKGGRSVSRDRAHMAAVGRKGGHVVSRDREHMAEIGRLGGKARRDAAAPVTAFDPETTVQS